LNTDLLMVLPYTAGAYLLVRSRWDAFNSKDKRSLKRSLALAGGALIGVAFQINPKAIFDVGFFGAFLVGSRRWNKNDIRSVADPSTREPTASSLFALAVVGVIAGSVPFLIQIAAGNAWSFYWAYVWDWGARYGG